MIFCWHAYVIFIVLTKYRKIVHFEINTLTHRHQYNIYNAQRCTQNRIESRKRKSLSRVIEKNSWNIFLPSTWRGLVCDWLLQLISCFQQIFLFHRNKRNANRNGERRSSRRKLKQVPMKREAKTNNTNNIHQHVRMNSKTHCVSLHIAHIFSLLLFSTDQYGHRLHLQQMLVSIELNPIIILSLLLKQEFLLSFVSGFVRSTSFELSPKPLFCCNSMVLWVL